MSLDSLLAGIPISTPMGAEEERALAREAQAGSSAAARSLADANVRLVVYLVRRIRRPEWISLDDLVQEGMLGLMHAISRFNPALGRFRPYAKHWIRHYAAEFIQRSRRRSCSPLEDVPEPVSDEDQEEALLDAEARYVANSAIAAAIEELDPHESATFAGTLAGSTHTEIGLQLRDLAVSTKGRGWATTSGYTRQNVSRIHRSARAKVVAAVRKNRNARSLFG